MYQINTARQFEEESLGLEGQLFEILKTFDGRPEELIPMLQTVQGHLGYLPEKALLEIAYLAGLPSAKVFGVATFYSQFRLQPTGKHIIRVCRGTACHVRGSGRILKQVQAHLQVAPGGTTTDRIFTLEIVSCFGSCALAPVVVIDDKVYGRMNHPKVLNLLEEITERENELKIAAASQKALGGQNELRIHESQRG